MQIDNQIADQIRAEYTEGLGYKALATKYGAPASFIRNIVLGRLFNEDGRVVRKPFSTPEKDQRMAGLGRYTL